MRELSAELPPESVQPTEPEISKLVEEYLVDIDEWHKTGEDQLEYLSTETWQENGPDVNSTNTAIKKYLIEQYGIQSSEVRICHGNEGEEYYQLIVELGRQEEQTSTFFVENYFHTNQEADLFIIKGEAGKVGDTGRSSKIDIPTRIHIAHSLSGLVNKPDDQLTFDELTSRHQKLTQALSELTENKHFEYTVNPFREMSPETLSEIKYISLDIDDTIFRTSKQNEVFDLKAIDQMAKNIALLQEEGVEVYLNSGRGLGDIKWLMQYLNGRGATLRYAVCENGSVFYDQKEDKYEIDEIINETGQELLGRIKEFIISEIVAKGYGLLEDKAIGISLDPTEAGQALVESEVSDVEVRFLRRKGEDYEVKKMDRYRAWVQKILKTEAMSQIVDDKDELEAVEVMIDNIVNSGTAVDLSPCGTNEDGRIVPTTKSSGVDLFCEKMGVNIEKETGKTSEIIGLGDASNDEPAFRRFEKSAVVWNGVTVKDDEIKEEERLGQATFHIFYIAPLPTTEGVNIVLSRLHEARTQLKK